MKKPNPQDLEDHEISKIHISSY